MNRANYLFI